MESLSVLNKKAMIWAFLLACSIPPLLPIVIIGNIIYAAVMLF